MLWHAGSAVVACNRLVAACGFSFPDQGSNPWCLHWKCGVLATGPQGKYQDVLILVLLPHYLHPAAKGIHFKRQLDCITPLIKTSKLIIIRKYPQPPAPAPRNHYPGTGESPSPGLPSHHCCPTRPARLDSSSDIG